eukprot:gene6301-6948_t
MNTDSCGCMKQDDAILSLFRESLAANVALPIAAMNTLVATIERSHAATWMQLEQELRGTIACLQTCTREDLQGRTNISLGSGCELFMKYVSRAFNMEFKDFTTCKEELLRRGARFADLSLNARQAIASFGHSFVQEGSTVLIHGISRVVTALLLRAAQTTYFNVVLTEGKPGPVGTEHAQTLRQAGIPTRIIPDSAVAVTMETIDMCLVGAEGVMENGGIINKVGTFQIALVAHASQKPFYVAVESYKFARIYPLSQRDMLQMLQQLSPAAPFSSQQLPQQQREQDNVAEEEKGRRDPDLVNDVPNVDFTPAKLITLLFTDIGVLTPAAVSDELIRLYQ